MAPKSSAHPSLNRLSRFDFKLWNRFVAITQPYWYPYERGSSKIFFGLVALLLVFLFALLFVIVSGVTLLCQQLFPELTQETAGGLVQLIRGIIGSPAIAIVLAGLFIPAVAFFLARDKVLPRWQQWAFLGLLLLLSLSVSGMNVVISYVGNFFTTALAEKNQPIFWRFFWVYAGVFAIATPFVVYYGYVQNLLGLRWRQWMTGEFLGQYFGHQSYYKINWDKDIDNPDQRIAQDINSFTVTSLSFLLLILGSVIDVLSFTGILWSISSLLAIALVGYALFGTVVMAILGQRLIVLNFNQLRKEADFRYGLVHIRDNAEAIAFYRGEQQEMGQVGRRFVEVVRNFNFLIGWQRNLAFFRTPYRYATYILPYVLLASLYFGGQIKFGDMTQANFAFAQVFEAFALVVLQINQLSEFAAGINRLETFTEALDTAEQPPALGETAIDTSEDSRIALEHVTLLTPTSQRLLVRDLSAAVPPGAGLVIVGASGAGKSSILRAIAGLWNSGTGKIVRPKSEEMLFLPQRPYMILGTLREQLLYPNTSSETSEGELQKALAMVNLSELPERVGGFDVELDWDDVLSLGEQQRLAIARLLLTKPAFAILDEATSALDLKNEQQVYEQIQATASSFVSVGHRPSLLRYHQYVLELSGDSHWRLLPTEEYQPSMEAFS
uniref:ABC transporter domain protein n=1 Tax=Cyanothece sp. (strain PCC 7425 / ATCC 29141) TaxID=395961 RepID=B8HQF7_CYAP4